MVHYTCDVCGKEMRPGKDAHHVVTIETCATHVEAGLTEADLDADHLEAIGEMLRELDEDEVAEVPDARQQLRFDMCPDCHQRFLRDPLGKLHPQPALFNKN